MIRRVVHGAYMSGGLLLVTEPALRIPVGETAAWQAITSAILEVGSSFPRRDQAFQLVEPVQDDADLSRTWRCWTRSRPRPGPDR